MNDTNQVRFSTCILSSQMWSFEGAPHLLIVGESNLLGQRFSFNALANIQHILYGQYGDIINSIQRTLKILRANQKVHKLCNQS